MRTTASDYFNSWINWGGEWAKVATVYADSPTQKAAEMWLHCYEQRNGIFLTECPSVCPDFYVA